MRTALFATLGALTLASAAQLPFAFQRDGPANGGLAPETAAGFVGDDVFTTLSHPEFSSHSLRIKQTTGWCDPTARSFTGYLDNGPRHLFFYFFDSRSDPAKDPLTLWTNGGPGCSSSMGLLMELGPCTAQKDGNSTAPNPHSWNSHSNMIFIDQPIGVGYSYSDSKDVAVATTEQAALDVHAFLNLFFLAFPDLKDRAFHLSGESYGGRYLPVFATEILYQNSLLAKKKDSKVSPINLKSVIIGNGLTDVVSMTTSYYDQACTAASGLGKPVLDVKACVAMQQEVKRCDKWLNKVCRDSLVQPECDIAADYCGTQFQLPFLQGMVNPYDISKPCTTLGQDLCYPETAVIKEYLDKPWIRQKLGVHESIGPFQSCSNKVGSAFAYAHDSLAPTFYHLTSLLENGIRVLIYVGEYDWICNFIGNYHMVEALEWSGQAGFVSGDLRNWSVLKGGEAAGVTKSFGDLTFATIHKAGHMVPLDKPVEALALVERWLSGEAL